MIGGVATLIAGWIALTFVGNYVPFAAVVGGGVAGYLHGGDYVDGGTVGTISALLALVPPSIVYLDFAGALLEGIPYGGHWGGAGVILLVFMFSYGVAVLGMATASGAADGVVGTYLRNEVGTGP